MHTTTIQPTIDLSPQILMPDAAITIASGSQSRNFRIPADVVNKATQDLEEEQRLLIRWLHGHCHNNDLDRNQLGQLLKKPAGGYYSVDSVLQLLKGDRVRKGETIDAIVDSIRPLREIEQKRQNLKTSGFIQTRLYREIEKRLDYARTRQRILFAFGDSQIGKSAAEKHYQQTHNHGQTIYVDMPTGGSLGKFVRALAKSFNITAKNIKIEQLQDRIVESLDSTMLLIVDNAHRALRCRTSYAGLNTLTWLQEVFDTCECGMGIFMTNEGRDDLTTGPHAKSLQQLWRRRNPPLQLPAITPQDDLALFAKAYGLPKATRQDIEVTISYHDEKGRVAEKKHTDNPLALQTRVNKEQGLGVWISILQNASDMATDYGRAITWGAVIKATAQSEMDAELFI